MAGHVAPYLHARCVSLRSRQGQLQPLGPWWYVTLPALLTCTDAQSHPQPLELVILP